MSVIVFLVFIAIFLALLFGLIRIAEGRGQTKSPDRIERSRPSAARRAKSRRSASRRSARQSSRRAATRLAEARGASRIPEARPTRSYTSSSSGVPPSKQTALSAMRRAGYDVGEEFVRVTDIGLLEYREQKRPRLLRHEQVRVDSDYVRPFAELWLPYRSRGTVRFELIETINGRPHLHYADEDEYDLSAGINPLLPGTWLPLQTKDIDSADEWHLRVMVGDTILADHIVGWRESLGGSDIQRHIASDGEISAELQQAISAQQNEAISLDDLLGD